MGVRLTIGLGVVLLATSCASPGGTPSPSPFPTVSAHEIPAPSSEPSGLPTGPADAVMSFTQTCDVLPEVNVPAATVLTDGRVLWRENNRLVVRQLTPESLSQFMDQVRSTGLFAASAQYGLERRAGTPEPPAHGLCVWSFTWRDDSSATVVKVVSGQWLGDEEESTYYEPSPERETLDALAQRLRDAATLVGDDGWAQPTASPYEPEEYLVLVSVTVPELATAGAPDFDDVTWPFDALPDEVGIEYRVFEPPSRCAVANAESVATLVNELSAAGLPDPYAAGANLPWQARAATVSLSFWPVLPDGRPSCEPRED